MAADPNVVELAVSRTLRDSLERIQRTSDELHQAVNDLVSACASSRPTNALPAMVRAQTSAASLTAVLEVLSRFVTIALRPAMESSIAQEFVQPAAAPPPLAAPQLSAPAPQPPTPPPAPVAEETKIPEAVASSSTETVAADAAPQPPVLQPPVIEPPVIAPPAPALDQVEAKLFVPEPLVPEPMGIDLPIEEPLAPVEASEEVSAEAPAQVELSVPVEPAPHVEVPAPAPPVVHVPPPAAPVFDVSLLSTDMQELHRRAYRVAKVSMQDIKMLRPEDVRVGRENKDLCFRLRDDIEKAHKEYQRRFQAIGSHPVDYFYDWMVEILAAGDSEALGEYPYSSAVLHH